MASDKIQYILDAYQKGKVKIESLTDDLLRKEDLIDEGKKNLENLMKARWTVTEVQRLTQERFKHRVETLVTMVIRSIFEDREFGFELAFEEKRNQMEVKPIVYEMIDGQKHVYENPEDDYGGGLVDVISFALRIVMWSLENPKSRNVIILDEPMKNMGSLILLGGQMLSEIAHKLGLQLIIITHDQELIDIADRSYHVTHDKYQSHVKLIQKGEK
ncbi:MAG: hypothetical protein PHG66_06835 [Candidatus Colwellbacteria bacterium]|nr:hypothetical protein [Candidatus Colwellbacteria bacterium]